MTADAHDDAHWMELALQAAVRGRGAVEPNPMVGCVVVRNDRVIASGFHARFGGPHAEVVALENLDPSELHDSTLYVSLEPCCHTGKTPPCVDLLLRKRPRRVVVAMLDPFPQVAGEGIARLQQAGIAVDVGVMEGAARQLNVPYLKLLEHQRPWVIAKWAMTLDGALAADSGDSKWISNETSRLAVHRLRSVCDAVIIGSQTALRDDPLLTTRLPEGESPARRAHRVVVDRQLRLPTSSQLVTTAREWPLVVATLHPDGIAPTDRAERTQRIAQLQEAGADVWMLPDGDPHAFVQDMLNEMGRRRWTNVLLEGGSKLLGVFWDAGHIDQVECFIAPKILGSGSALTPVSGIAKDWMNQARSLHRIQWEKLGDDFHFRGFTAPCVENNDGIGR
ncbi:MAG: bifunctional diaminohydroxyphosphoribosylaminopyrimidine deaminase/5-amino-6-(5-phosphoribosylamino)uracil reductase RibD [Pirellula sp.]